MIIYNSKCPVCERPSSVNEQGHGVCSAPKDPEEYKEWRRIHDLAIKENK